MRTLCLLIIFLSNLSFLTAQNPLKIGRTTEVKVESVGNNYIFHAKRGNIYKIDINQRGLDVVLNIKDSSNTLIAEVDSPSGSFGTESYTFKSKKDELIHVHIYPFEDQDFIEGGQIDIRFNEIEQEFARTWKKEQRKISRENRRNIQTLDIQNFWEAYDALADVSTLEDSVEVIQRLYIDRATDGFKQFMQVRPETNAFNYVQALRMFPKFYASLRENTDVIFESEKDVQYVFDRFEKVYSRFKPFKVCFLIGTLNTGGTATDDYVLIGSEITCSTAKTDLSEFKNPPFNQLIPHLNYAGDISQKIRNIVAHECVHTQQPNDLDIAEQSCQLLHASLSEGFCDFVGEYLVGEQINANLVEFGDQHEEELWNSFKDAMCEDDLEDWLYNYGRFKDKPADLGYYIGYVVARNYYAEAKNKEQAIKDLIEFRNAEEILKASKYDSKWN